VLGQFEDSHPLCGAHKHPRGYILVHVAGGIVVSHHNYISAAQLLAMLERPLRSLAGFGGTVGTAGGGNAERPQIVRVLLAFYKSNLFASLNGRHDLWQTIQNRWESFADLFPNPAAMAVGLALREVVLIRRQNAKLQFLIQQLAVCILVVMDAGEI
jgi:hypothetical protein